ncbi:MAG TPA: hypothetical protein VH302_13120 [Bryobacteraceae bacterium]|jgi:hypothetical protein|nr:hypothetical protein [Bryobacteraceae bacterium]
MSPLSAAAIFLKSRWLRFAIVSALVLVPCFWHAHIEAGDLGSHVYNAWLVNLVHKGQIHDLEVRPQWNNVLCDWLLFQIGRTLGWNAAEKIVVSLCVLCFFWGTFAFLAAASRRPPWVLAPAIAMIAYGYTFQMGFFNYYLAIGLALLAIALVWHGSKREWMVAALLAVIVCLAHPIGLLTMFGFIAYIKLAQHTRGWLRLLPLVLALATVVAGHFYILRFRVNGWLPFYQMNGADQLFLYGARYAIISYGFLLLLLVSIFYSFIRLRKQRPFSPDIRIALELWAVLLFSAAMIPELIFLPQFAAPVALFVSRGTMLCAVLLLCVIACLQPQRWQLAAFSVLAAALFAFLFQDTGKLGQIEDRAQQMFRALPYGSRIAVTIGPPPVSRMWFICHMLDRACIGHCFTYTNYEPPSGQFWIHSKSNSRTAMSSAEEQGNMQFGTYKVKESDLPLKQIYQCRVEDIGTLCMRDLHAGEINCPNCNQPFYWFMHTLPQQSMKIKP